MKKSLSSILVIALLSPLLSFAETDEMVHTMQLPPPLNANPGALQVDGKAASGTPKNTAPRPTMNATFAASTTFQKPPQPSEMKPAMRGSTTSPIMASTTRPQQDMNNQGAPLTRPNASSSNQLGFCSQLEKVLANIDTKSIKMIENRESATTTKKQEDGRQSIAKQREESDAKRKTQLEELTKRATTETQKQVLTAFTVVMEKALTTKEKAIDAVLLAHKTEVDLATDARRSDVEKAMTILTTSVEAAKKQAKADCENGQSSEVARQTLRTSIESANEVFRSTVKDSEKIKDVSEESRNQKKEQLKKIDEDFKASVLKARDDLKASFKVSATASTTVQ